MEWGPYSSAHTSQLEPGLSVSMGMGARERAVEVVVVVDRITKIVCWE
jgi:hypothetical protein